MEQKESEACGLTSLWVERATFAPQPTGGNWKATNRALLCWHNHYSHRMCTYYYTGMYDKISTRALRENPPLNASGYGGWRISSGKLDRRYILYLEGNIGSFPWERKFNKLYGSAFAKGKAVANVRALEKLNSFGKSSKGIRARAQQTLV